VGAGREDAQNLSDKSSARRWPLVVRRAREEDRESVLRFASETWHGWDYVPNAWPVWLSASDGAFLVGTVGEPGAADAAGEPLDTGQVVAITRVALAAPKEAWLEGIRVDPRVRGMGVAADLQIAELQWVAAQNASVVRYATGANNEGSHRLGAKDGINLLVVFRSLWWTEDPEADEDELSAFDADVRAAVTAKREMVLGELARRGSIAHPADADVLWRLVLEDPSFQAGLRLYEPRAWAMNELTHDAFVRHLERGEVVVSGIPANDSPEGWALAIVPSVQLPSEDSALRAALLVGGVEPAIQLLETVRSVAGETLRLRLAEAGPLFADNLDRFGAAGYRSPKWAMHILARRMDDGVPIPAPDPGRVVLADQPDRLEPPRW
jgi:GNAT superfamily N-acetyltransferase